MHDKRLSKRLEDYWNRLRGRQKLPSWNQFNPSLVEDIWPQCCTLLVEKDASNRIIYRYVHIGDIARDIFGTDMTGHIVAPRAKHFPGARIIQDIDTVVREYHFLNDEGQFVNELNKIVKFRACLVPFGSESGGVTHVICGLSWREF